MHQDATLQQRQSFRQWIVTAALDLLPPGEPPPLYVSVAGSLQSKGNFSYELDSERIAIHVFHAGSGVIEVSGGTRRSVRGGDVFVFFPGQRLTYRDERRKPWRYTWLVFDGSQARHTLARCGFTPNTPHRTGIPTELQVQVTSIVRTLRTRRYAFHFPISAAWRVIEQLAKPAPAAAYRRTARSVAETCRDLIGERYRNAPTISELAELLGVDASTLLRHFKSQFGVGPKEYLERHRLEKARELLRNSRESVQSVAALCGYADADYFIRVFRKQYGAPPARWRLSASARSGTDTGGLGAAVRRKRPQF